jgi:hypothetical protein
MSNSGPTIEIAGNMAIASAAVRIARLPGNSSRAMAYAAIVPSSTAMTVEISAMPAEFTSARVKMSCWKIPL